MNTTIGEFRSSVTDRIGLLKARTVLDLHNGLTRVTPKRSGRAAAAWNVSTGAPDLSVPPEAETVPLPAPPALGKIAPGVDAWVANNLPYIGPLNNGHSGQAPAGFVQSEIDRVVAAMDGHVREVKRLGEAGRL